LPRDMAVDLVVYSVEGRPVRQLRQGSRVAGTHQVVWDGSDQQSRDVPSGIYLVRMVTEDGVHSRKIVLAK
jgi:flagellar hook assembly protein FlgD